MGTLEHIEGIGPATAVKLRQAGVPTIEALLDAVADAKKRKALAGKTNIPEAKLLRFAHRADLMRIEGIGSEYAELVEAAGVHSVHELAQSRVAELVATMRIVNKDKNLVRRVASKAQVQRWIDEASALQVPPAQPSWVARKYGVWDSWEAVQRINHGLSTDLLEEVAAFLGLTNNELSELLQISERTLSRRKLQDTLRPDESERLYRIMRLIDLASDVLGSDDDARAWLKEDNYALSDMTPLELAKSEPGAAIVERLLLQVRHGVAV